MPEAGNASDQTPKETFSFLVHGTGALPAPSAEATKVAQDLSETTGATVDQAVLYSEATVPWDVAIDKISRAEPDNFATAYRKSVTEGIGHIAFVQQPTRASVSELVALPFDSEVVVGAPASAVNLAAAANSADTIVRDVGLTPLSTTTDIITSAITVKVAAGASEDTMEKGRVAVESAVARVIGVGSVRTYVEVGGDDDTFVPTAYNPGGGKDLWSNTDPPEFACTSGFATTRGGVNGVTTAKHCYNYLLWGKTAGVISYTAPAANAGTTNGVANEVDLQFHRSLAPNSAAPRFNAIGPSSSDVLSVDAARNAVVGDYVNKYGRMGGYTHGCLVTELNFPADYVSDDGLMHHFVGAAKVSTTGPNCPSFQDGDSGGPIWSADAGTVTARGSVAALNGTGTLGLYVPQTRWSENLGASILLDN